VLLRRVCTLKARAFVSVGVGLSMPNTHPVPVRPALLSAITIAHGVSASNPRTQSFANWAAVRWVAPIERACVPITPECDRPAIPKPNPERGSVQQPVSEPITTGYREPPFTAEVALMLDAIISAAMIRNVSGTPVDPATAIDATCYGSTFHLGTRNIPITNEQSTTTTNEWAVLGPGSKPIAWIAKNASDQYWIQWSRGNDGSDLGPALRMSSFAEYDADFAKSTGVVTPCFTKDLPQ
jgi:hypothetical protein